MARTSTTPPQQSAGGNHPHGQGTFGGLRHAVGGRPGSRPLVLGDEMYLWLLVLAEVGVIAYCRKAFSRYHGG